MKLTVMSELCTGHGLCVDTAPELFELNELGVAIVRVAEIPVESEQAARKAVFLCPEGAIVIPS